MINSNLRPKNQRLLPSYRIHEIRREDGERLPILVEPNGTVPFLPAYYVMSICRPQNASSTIRIKLESIRFLYIWGKVKGIDIEDRFKRGEMLSLDEIDNLVYYCKLSLGHLTSKFEKYPSNTAPISIPNSTVDHTTQAKRLNTISHYIEWMTYELMKRMDKKKSKYQIQINALQEVLSAIKNRTVSRIGRTQSRINPPKGFSKEVQDRLLEVIEINHPENPWTNKFVKIRNQLYVTMSLAVGLRIGESLNIKLEDVDLSGEYPKIRIRRRPDDPEEDRNKAPRVKTLERTLPIGRHWAMLINTYTKKYRNKIRGAKKHKFLFVSKKGNKLSYSAACEIFNTLKNKIGDLPDNLSQHLCRHAWNERFSEKAERQGLSADEIREYRRQIMGWSASSKMPELYDRRFIRKKTDALSLEMQQEYFKDKK